MAQINKGTVYSTTNSTVTIANLNTHVDGATLLPGSISEQTDLAANVDPSSLQISVLSAGLLKKATVLQALGGINPSTLLAKASNLSDLSDASVSRTNLGIGNVENKSSATIRSEITSANLTSLSSSNVTTALGYIPLSTASTVDPVKILPGITPSQIAAGLTSAQIASIATTALPASGAAGGTYGSNASVPQITVDSTGRITSVSSVGITGAAGGTVTSVGVASTTLAVTNSPVTASGQIGVNLQASGVTGGTYGSASSIPVVAVNANGIVTGASNQPVSIAANQVLSGITSAQITGLSASQVGVGIAASQIAGVNAAQVGTGISDSQISALSVTKVSGLAANVSSFLQTPSSANLAAALTDEVGTGSVVFASGVVGSGSAVLASAVTGTGSAMLATLPTVQEPTINGYNEGVIALGVVGANPAQLTIATGTVITATLTTGTATTFTLPPVAAGKSFVLYLKQPISGSVGTVAFVTSPTGNIVWPAGAAPAATPTLGRLDIFSFVSDGAKWYGNASRNYTY